MMKTRFECKFKTFSCSIERSFEGGLVYNWFLKTNEASLSQIMKNVKVYRSLEEYADNLTFNTLHMNIRLENLSRAFALFFFILVCISIGFAVAWYLPETRKRLKIFRLNARSLAIEQLERIRMRIARFSVVLWLRCSFLVAKPRSNSASGMSPEAGQCGPITNDQRSSSI